jgi:hypothetical protein
MLEAQGISFQMLVETYSEARKGDADVGADAGKEKSTPMPPDNTCVTKLRILLPVGLPLRRLVAGSCAQVSRP